jgi:hypothetical protein
VLQGEEDVILIQKENWKWMQRSEAAGMKERLLLSAHAESTAAGVRIRQEPLLLHFATPFPISLSAETRFARAD